MPYTAPLAVKNSFDTLASFKSVKPTCAAILLSGVSLAAAAGLISGSANAQFGDGFKQFPQDSCDPLLSGVLTEDGYQPADLDELYQLAYNADVRTGCGFTKVSDVSTVTPPQNPFPDPVAQPFPNPPAFDPNPQPTLLQGDPFNTIDVPEPIDLPDLDLLDEPTGSGTHTGLYARLFGAYVKTKGSAGTLSAGPTTFTDTTKSGYGGSATLGYAFNFEGLSIFNNLRSEIQGSYYQLDGDPFVQTTGALTATQSKETLMGGFVNLVADIEFGLLPITPYVGAGIGYGRRDIDFGGDSFKEDGLLYQGMIGGRYSITERLSLDLGYKYLKSFDVKTAIGANGNYTLGGRDHHIVEGGVTFKF